MSDTITVNVSPPSVSVTLYDEWSIGPRGYSAYQVAVINGYVGTEVQWLNSLKGANGKSAYQVAVDNGFVGTEAEWLASFHYDPGYTPENSANKVSSIGADSSTQYPNVTAVKTHVASVASTTLSSAESYANGVASTAESNAKAYADSIVASVLKLIGNHDASANTYPAGTIKKGYFWYISVAGILKGKAVNIGDAIYALADNPGQTDANWEVMESNIGFVPEQAGVAASLIAAHVSSSDPHGDRAAASAALSSHVSANDPHGDRAYAYSIGQKTNVKSSFIDDFEDFNESNGRSISPRLTTLTCAEMTSANLNWIGGARLISGSTTGGFYRTYTLGKNSGTNLSVQPSRGPIEACISIYVKLCNSTSTVYFGWVKDSVENLGESAKLVTLEMNPSANANWRMRLTSGSFVDTGVAANTATEYKMKLRVFNGTATAFINGIQVAQSGVGADDSTTYLAAFGFTHAGAGQNDVDVWADYIGRQQTLSSARTNYGFD